MEVSGHPHVPAFYRQEINPLCSLNRKLDGLQGTEFLICGHPARALITTEPRRPYTINIFTLIFSFASHVPVLHPGWHKINFIFIFWLTENTLCYMINILINTLYMICSMLKYFFYLSSLLTENPLCNYGNDSESLTFSSPSVRTTLRTHPLTTSPFL